MPLDTSGSAARAPARVPLFGNPLMAAGIAAIALLASGAPSVLAAGAPTPTTGAPGIDLQVTLGSDLSDGACGSDTQLDVTQLDQINFCYILTNHTSDTLNYQTLSDDVVGTLLSAAPITLAPGASKQYNRIITARESQAPISRWTAYDVHPGYAFTANETSDALFVDGFDGRTNNGPPTYAFEDITKIGTPLNLDGSFTLNLDIGFPFTYYGETSSQVVVSDKGGIQFGVTEGWLPYENTPLPNAELGAAILPYWTDIYYQQPEDGNQYAATLGTAPNRRFVVEWFNVPIMVGGVGLDSATFQMILFEGSNEILFQYADTDVGDPLRDDGVTATIGLNPPAGVDAALQYSYNQPAVNAGKAILFSPTTPTSYSDSQQVTLVVGVPKIATSPARFDVGAAAGASTSAALTIGNVGNRPLNWKVGSFSARDHFPPVSRFTLPVGNPALTRGGPAPLRPGPTSGRSDGNAVPFRGANSFAIDLATSSLVGLDFQNPGSVNPVAGLGDLILTAGAFVDEDFTRLYAIDYYTYDLLTVDTSNGATNVIGTAHMASGAGWNWTSMAWDSSTGKLYGVTYTPSRNGTLTSYLYTINPVTAETTLIGTITGVGDPSIGNLIAAIAIDSNGALYGIDLVADDFVAIDKTNGEGAVLGSLGFDANYAQSLDFDDYTGALYYAARNDSEDLSQMYTIDPISGALTLQSPIGADPLNTQLAAFSIARLGGVCAYPNDVPWLSYDMGNGTVAAGDSDLVNVTFDASKLGAGTYTGYVCVVNNDLTNRRVAVPVKLTVQ